MKGLYRTELAIVLSVVAAFVVLGNFDFAAELEREALEKEARPCRVIADQREAAQENKAEERTAALSLARSSASLPNTSGPASSPTNINERRGNGKLAALVAKSENATEVCGTDTCAAHPTYTPCQKLQNGRWLRTEVMHRGDIERLRVECYYSEKT